MKVEASLRLQGNLGILGLDLSPQMATVSPSNRPSRRRMVRASSNAWVGCSCWPSPALTTAQLTFWASRSGAPEA